MENNQIRTILLALASQLDAGADTSSVLKDTATQLSTAQEVSTDDVSVATVELPPKKKHPLQIPLKAEDVVQIRSLFGIISNTQLILKQQETLLLALISELKGYYNVPTEVGYDLNLANKEGEVNCFIREDLVDDVAQHAQNLSPSPKKTDP